MKYLIGKDYPNICGACQHQVDLAVEMCQDSLAEDEYESDEEGPINIVFDNRAFCGGHTCTKDLDEQSDVKLNPCSLCPTCGGPYRFNPVKVMSPKGTKWQKIRLILHHGETRGHPLTVAQRGMFGAWFNQMKPKGHSYEWYKKKALAWEKKTKKKTKRKTVRKKAKKKTTRKALTKRKCGNCDRKGHNKRTCKYKAKKRKVVRKKSS